MRIIFSILVMLLVCSNVNAVEINLDAIKMIESSNGRDKRVSSKGAVGLMQITPICLKDYNIQTKSKYTMKDMWNDDINFKVGSWYINVRIPQFLRAYRFRDYGENRLLAYNMGIGRMRKLRSIYGNRWHLKLPTESKNYLKKYWKIIGETNV
jgi:soluble lytic murein transglycosylase-like protein